MRREDSSLNSVESEYSMMFDAIVAKDACVEPPLWLEVEVGALALVVSRTGEVSGEEGSSS